MSSFVFSMGSFNGDCPYIQTDGLTYINNISACSRDISTSTVNFNIRHQQPSCTACHFGSVLFLDLCMPIAISTSSSFCHREDKKTRRQSSEREGTARVSLSCRSPLGVQRYSTIMLTRRRSAPFFSWAAMSGAAVEEDSNTSTSTTP